MKQSESLPEGISYIVTTRTIKSEDGTAHIVKEISPLIHCGDCKYYPQNFRHWKDDDPIQSYIHCKFMDKDDYCSKAKSKWTEWLKDDE